MFELLQIRLLDSPLGGATFHLMLNEVHFCEWSETTQEYSFSPHCRIAIVASSHPSASSPSKSSHLNRKSWHLSSIETKNNGSIVFLRHFIRFSLKKHS